MNTGALPGSVSVGVLAVLLSTMRVLAEEGSTCEVGSIAIRFVDEFGNTASTKEYSTSSVVFLRCRHFKKTLEEHFHKIKKKKEWCALLVAEVGVK